VDCGVVGEGVFASDAECQRAQVDADDGLTEFGGEGNADGAGADAGVGNAANGARELEDEFDEVFSFRARNQDTRDNLEVAGEELLAADDVLNRLTGDALVEVAPEVDPGEFREGIAGVTEKENALLAERVHEQEFSREAGRINIGLLEQFDALHEGLANGEIRRHS
jgi:hypothetical protein